MAIQIGNSSRPLGDHGSEDKMGMSQTFGSVLDEMVSAEYSGTELGPWGFLTTDSKQLMAELSRDNCVC